MLLKQTFKAICLPISLSILVSCAGSKPALSNEQKDEILLKHENTIFSVVAVGAVVSEVTDQCMTILGEGEEYKESIKKSWESANQLYLDAGMKAIKEFELTVERLNALENTNAEKDMAIFNSVLKLASVAMEAEKEVDEKLEGTDAEKKEMCSNFETAVTGKEYSLTGNEDIKADFDALVADLKGF